MNEALGAPVNERTSRLVLTTVFMRIVALLLLVIGLARACLILGITPSGATFTDLSTAWRAAATILLIVDLFAAVGLWMGAVWGPVMWSVALAIEIAMYTAFADLFGPIPIRVIIHAAIFAGFLAISFVEWRRVQVE